MRKLGACLHMGARTNERTAATPLADQVCACASRYKTRTHIATRLFQHAQCYNRTKLYAHKLTRAEEDQEYNFKMAASAANTTAKFCRRLFQDAAPRVVSSQTVDQVIRADQERFSSRWNFDVARGFAKEAPSGQTPWKVIQKPKATFYTATPRRLKARRRLNPSVAERLRQELATPKKGVLTESPLLGNFTFDFSPLKIREEPRPVPTILNDEPCNETATAAAPSTSDQSVAPTPTTTLDAEPVIKISTPKSKAAKRKSNPKMTGKLIHLTSSPAMHYRLVA